ncbi:MAG: cytochrome c oxidase subunit II [Rickettsiales bacterium]|nr:cytochrome c oxidase subunit II [Rickettsiales bacterium]
MAGKTAAKITSLLALQCLWPALAMAEGANPARIATDGIVKGYAKEWQLGMQKGVTPVQEGIKNLHDNELLTICIVISVFVLALLIYVCIRFSEKRNPVPSRVTHNTLVEVIWTTVPIMILIGIAIPSLRLHHLMYTLEKPEMTLKVTGYQWYWGYEYPDVEGVAFESRLVPDAEIDKSKGQIRLLSVDHPVVVPVDTTVRVNITGNDVIHSWSVPAFGVKTDAVPGRLNQAWFRISEPGIYYGQCSELCGVYHGFMPIEIRAVEKEVYKQWIERAKGGDYALDGISIPRAPMLADLRQTTQ